MKQAVSLFPPGITNLQSSGNKSITAIYNIVTQHSGLKTLTEFLRTLPLEQQNKFKNCELPYVTWGGTFKFRKDADLIEASGLICIDIDKLEHPKYLKQKLINESSYVVLVFISPTGTGLKVVFNCNPNFSFKDNYEALSRYVSDLIGLKRSQIDKQCSNISRACYLSHDSEAFLNPLVTDEFGSSKISFLGEEFFKAKDSVAKSKVDEDEEGDEQANFFDRIDFQYYPLKFNFEKRQCIENFMCLARINKRDNGELKVGNRHNWFLHLSYLTNRFGLTKDRAIKFCKSLFKNQPAILDKENHFDEQNDLIRPFDDTYEKFKEEFGTWTTDDKEWETPVLPDKIYDNLPDFLQSICNLFSEHHEKDNFLLGCLTLLSSMTPRIKGYYDKRVYSPNLFLFIIAPPASGKGVLTWVRKLGEGIHQEFLDRYKDEIEEYNAASEEDKKDMIKPILRKFFIPANNTSARLIASIHANQNFGIVMDTEADVVTNANKAEHGHFSEIFRKAFQNEAYEYERKGNSEYLVIPETILSILISGTPRQFKYLIGDSENGLASRFMYHNYYMKPTWKDVFADDKDYNYIFISEQRRLKKMVSPYLIDYSGNSEDDIIFRFSDEQRKIFNETFAGKLDTMVNIFGDDIQSCVFRLGLIHFRISLILSALRQIENLKEGEVLPDRIFCNDLDFQTALQIVDTLLHHTATSFNNLNKKGGSHKNYKKIKDTYIEKLPISFNRKQAMDIANLLQIKEKTAEKYLTEAIEEGLIIKPKHNEYQKAQK